MNSRPDLGTTPVIRQGHKLAINAAQKSHVPSASDRQQANSLIQSAYTSETTMAKQSPAIKRATRTAHAFAGIKGPAKGPNLTPSASKPATYNVASRSPKPSDNVSNNSQHSPNSIKKSRAVAEEQKRENPKERHCKPSPDPLKGSGQGGTKRTFVPWQSREDLKCR